MSDTITANPGSLVNLALSTRALYTRFGVEPELEACIGYFEEECRELIEAARDGSDPAHTAEEAVDVFVTAIGILLASGIPMTTLFAEVRHVAAKNDRKTHETHEYVDGKIRRRKQEGTNG